MADLLPMCPQGGKQNGQQQLSPFSKSMVQAHLNRLNTGYDMHFDAYTTVLEMFLYIVCSNSPELA